MFLFDSFMMYITMYLSFHVIYIKSIWRANMTKWIPSRKKCSDKSSRPEKGQFA